jgi:hypothetical protein
MKNAELIIAAFDQCLDYTFGRSLGRDNPHKDDAATAHSWVSNGADLVLCIMVFSHEMSWMHEKYLRSGPLRERRFIPHSLKVFDENIAAALRRSRAGGHADDWEKADSLWRSRVTGWTRKPALWRAETWGPPPGKPGCRVPPPIVRTILAVNAASPMAANPTESQAFTSKEKTAGVNLARLRSRREG